MSEAILVSGAFEQLRAPAVRFLQEAARLGQVHALLWADAVVESIYGRSAQFPQQEREYVLGALRYVDQVTVADGLAAADQLPAAWHGLGGTWAVPESEDNPAKRAFCAQHGLGYRVIADAQMQGFPIEEESIGEGAPERKKVLVTGCFDWLHSGHVRFFEEAAAFGDLIVVVGSDANVRNLKGASHPLFSQDERRYLVQAMRSVHQALISTGWGWMDAEPEIERLRPDIYLVNEDGDKPEKRAFCVEHGLEYIVLRRLPKAGLPPRASTHLRGF